MRLPLAKRTTLLAGLALGVPFLLAADLVFEDGAVGIGVNAPSRQLVIASQFPGDGIALQAGGGANSPAIAFPHFLLGEATIGRALQDGHFSQDALVGDLVLRSWSADIVLATNADTQAFPAAVVIRNAPEDEAVLEVAGGTQLSSTKPRPSCTTARRGLLWFKRDVGLSGEDSLAVCARDDSGSLGWRELF